ncbi:NUDIX hydrolase [Actinomarinicola tropica]|uniref:NUDIX hydrolase n=1 Tax=Actinomarinicola tropica TaxID=2789776 RepID=UPI001899E296|nr:NUDIX hydrolase [Actinomarinicola tropica]
MREWLVAGGLILGPEGLLLVKNVRRNGRADWTPPGGVIDEGEDLVTGLTREVKEETGLTVESWLGPVYRLETMAPGLGWHMRFEAHLAVEVSGELAIDDPDGIVVDAAWVDVDVCGERLATTHPWVREPLVEWLAERWDDERSFGYHVDGANPADLVVRRV